MKALTLALLLSVPVLPLAPKKPIEQSSIETVKHVKGGRWYFAATGHAIYCYGPVMTVPRADGGLQRVATFCRDGNPVVPLKE